MKATKIKMIPGCDSLDNVRMIDSLYVDQLGVFLKKDMIHDYLLTNPSTISVDVYPYPYLRPATNARGEKDVCSGADSTKRDNLFDLPRYWFLPL